MLRKTLLYVWLAGVILTSGISGALAQTSPLDSPATGPTFAPPPAQNAPASPAAPAARTDTTTLTPTIDTWVSEAPGSSGDNHAGEQLIFVGQDEFSYDFFALLQFDLASIPAGASVTGASLALFHDASQSTPLETQICAYRIDTTWDGTVTGDTAPGVDTTCQGSPTAVKDVTGIHTWGDLSPLVSDWLSGGHTNYGLALKLVPSATGAPAKAFQSSEGNVAPSLTITYTVQPQSTDAQMRFGQPRYDLGDCLRPELYDPAFNTDSNQAETVSVSAYSNLTEDMETIVLTEDGPDSSNFTAAAGCTPVDTGTPADGDGTLQSQPGDFIAAAVTEGNTVRRLAMATVKGGTANGEFQVQIDSLLLPALLASTPGMSGEPDFPLAMVKGPDGLPSLFGEDQVILVTNHEPELQAFLTRRGGKLLRTSEIEYADGQTQQYHLIRLDPSTADRTDMAYLMEQYLGVKGTYTYSSEPAAKLINLILEEQLAGHMVLPHALLQGQDEPYTNENSARNGYDFTWFDPSLVAADSVGLGKALTLAEILDLRESASPVQVAIIDGGFAAPGDYPTGSAPNQDFGLAFNSIPQCSFDPGGIPDCSAGSAGGSNPLACSGTVGCDWHGSMTFSVSSAEMNNNYGAIGTGAPVADPILMKISYPYLLPAAEAIVASVARGADVINMSSTFPCRALLIDACNPIENSIAVGLVTAIVAPACALLQGLIPGLGDLTCAQITVLLSIPPMASALQAAVAGAQLADVVVVAAAGNDVNILGIDIDAPPPLVTQNIPCVYPGVLCVGELESPDGVDLQWDDGTAGGPGVHIYAPAGIESMPNPDTAPSNDRGGGTSGSTAFMSGVVALVRGINPALRFDQVISLVEEAGCRTGSLGRVAPLGPCRAPIGDYINDSPGGYVDVRNTVLRALESVTPATSLDPKLVLCTGGWDEVANPADSAADAIPLTFSGTSGAGGYLVSEVSGDLSIHNQTLLATGTDRDFYSFDVPAGGAVARVNIEELAGIGQIKARLIDSDGTTPLTAYRAAGTPLERELGGATYYVEVTAMDPASTTDDNCYGGSTLTVALAVLADTDRFEPNESNGSAATLSPWTHTGWLCGASSGSTPGCTDVFEDAPTSTPAFLSPTARDVWRMEITDLTLSPADDRDFYVIHLPDYTDPIWGPFHADIQPGPGEEALLECGQVTRREFVPGMTSPQNVSVDLSGQLEIRVVAEANSLAARPINGAGETLHLYTLGGTSADAAGAYAPPRLRQVITCPQSEEDLADMIFSFGERPDVRDLLDSANGQGYKLILEYRISAHRGYPAGGLDPAVTGELNCGGGSIGGPFGPLPIPAFPWCPDGNLIGIPFPFDPGCVACADGEWFFVDAPNQAWTLSAQFDSAADMSFDLYDTNLQLIASAQPPTLMSVSNVLQLSADLEAGRLYLLKVSGPVSSTYSITHNVPPGARQFGLFLPMILTTGGVNP